jgi:TonB-linked SusC/RagA family outer membrane protein
MKKNRFLNSLVCRGVLIMAVIAFGLCLFSPNISFANDNALQDKKLIKGTVTDQKTSNSLPGLTVVVKGTSVGTVTDIDGKFSIMASEKDVLEFSFIGYSKKEVVVGNQTTINISMSEDVMGLDEVVVTGYGVQKKSDLTGAVSSVSGEALNKLPTATIDQALQGQAAGVNITAKSGRPGEAVDIQIRGISSINGTQPLVIIDGVSGDLNAINPGDIESIEVLKDASSAAIYGATGGNGVILVTTKKGSAGKITTSINVYRGIESASKKLDLMNSQEWMAVNEESVWEDASAKKRIGMKALNSQPDTLKTYNWQDILYVPALAENYDINVSGGNDYSSIMLSASYNNQEGIIKSSEYKRYTFRMNAEQKLTKRITFDENISFVNTVNKGLEEWPWHNYYNNPLYFTLLMDPSVPAYNEDGSWGVSNYSSVNPLVALDNKDKTVRQNIFNGTFSVKINLFKGLDFTSRLSGKMQFGDNKEYVAKYYATATDNNKVDRLIQSMDRQLSWTAQNYLTYQTTIAYAHNISIMVGMEANKWWDYDISGTRYDMASTDPWMLYFVKSTNSTLLEQLVTGTGNIGANQAYFGRLNYDYKGKYLLTLNMRRDGSSSFGPAYRWGNFPSFSVGWKFSEEKFIKNIEAISFGKLRFGYGQTGANARSGFPFLSSVVSRDQFRYSFDNTTSQIGTGPSQIANTEVRWESVNMSNLGLDMAFFDNRLAITADVFNKVNDGMLMYKEVSRVAGTYYGSDPEVNVGSIGNKGYELTITGRKKEGELRGSIGLNLSGVRNEVLELATDSMEEGKVHSLTPTNLTCIGQPVAQFYGYLIDERDGGLFREYNTYVKKGSKTICIDQPYRISGADTIYAQTKAVAGDRRYKDVNGDGAVDAKDRVNLGSPLPKLTFGMTVNLEYKGFDLSAAFNGTYGNKILNGTKQYLYWFQGNDNHAKEFADRYVENDIIKLDENGNEMVVVHQNLDTDLPKNKADNYNKLCEWHIEDGSYVRLKNLVIGYTIPNKLTSKINIQKVRIYGGAKNLFTLTKYTGISPEVAGKGAETGSTTILESGVDLGVYPTTRMFYFGANIVF